MSSHPHDQDPFALMLQVPKTKPKPQTNNNSTNAPASSTPSLAPEPTQSLITAPSLSTDHPQPCVSTVTTLEVPNEHIIKTDHSTSPPTDHFILPPQSFPQLPNPPQQRRGGIISRLFATRPNRTPELPVDPHVKARRLRQIDAARNEFAIFVKHFVQFNLFNGIQHDLQLYMIAKKDSNEAMAILFKDNFESHFEDLFATLLLGLDQYTQLINAPPTPSSTTTAVSHIQEKQPNGSDLDDVDQEDDKVLAQLKAQQAQRFQLLCLTQTQECETLKDKHNKLVITDTNSLEQQMLYQDKFIESHLSLLLSHQEQFNALKELHHKQLQEAGFTSLPLVETVQEEPKLSPLPSSVENGDSTDHSLGSIDSTDNVETIPNTSQQFVAKVRVDNLPRNYSPLKFKALCEQYGPVVSFWIVPACSQHCVSGASSQAAQATHGFVKFKSCEDAVKAIEGLNTESIGTYNLLASEAPSHRDVRRLRRIHQQPKPSQIHSPLTCVVKIFPPQNVTIANIAIMVQNISKISMSHGVAKIEFFDFQSATAGRAALPQEWSPQFFTAHPHKSLHRHIVQPTPPISDFPNILTSCLPQQSYESHDVDILPINIPTPQASEPSQRSSNTHNVGSETPKKAIFHQQTLQIKHMIDKIGALDVDIDTLILSIEENIGESLDKPSSNALPSEIQKLVLDDQTPIVEEATPVVEAVTPVVEEAVAEEATPVVEEAVEEATPIVEEAVEEATPVVEEATPVVEEATPVVEETELNSSQIAQNETNIDDTSMPQQSIDISEETDLVQELNADVANLPIRPTFVSCNFFESADFCNDFDNGSDEEQTNHLQEPTISEKNIEDKEQVEKQPEQVENVLAEDLSTKNDNDTVDSQPVQGSDIQIEDSDSHLVDSTSTTAISNTILDSGDMVKSQDTDHASTIEQVTTSIHIDNDDVVDNFYADDIANNADENQPNATAEMEINDNQVTLADDEEDDDDYDFELVSVHDDDFYQEDQADSNQLQDEQLLIQPK